VRIIRGGSEHLVEGGGELRIAIPDQELFRTGLFSQDEAQIASLLGDPLPNRIGGDADQVGPECLGEGSTPWRRRIAHTEDGARSTPIVASSPWILR